ncbi:MAG: hypothetical protein J7L26_12660 [Candidatus Aminicenantes bacterium]|nr:hypothetical protein [Candidatus Aminicenantes bacterium]
MMKIELLFTITFTSGEIKLLWNILRSQYIRNEMSHPRTKRYIRDTYRSIVEKLREEIKKGF